MFITKKHLSRRTLLRGAGAALALPLLESMVPAQTPLANTAANPVRRLGFVYVAHGIIMQQFIPAQASLAAGIELPRILKPINAFKDQLTIVSGLDNRNGILAGAGHPGAASTWISGAKCKKTEGEDVFVGPTIDQIAAQHIGQATIFPSLELATEDASGMVGACDVGFSCTYVNTISWRSATTPNPMEINPRIVFDRLVGEGGTREGRTAKTREDRSILDSLTQELSHLKGELGAGDRAAVADYMDNVREIERRIQLSENRGSAIADLESPVGVPDNYEEHIKLMFDLQVLAYQADLTRVSTFVLARELNQRAYLALGVPDSHHSLSHHQNDPARIEKLAKIQTYHMSLFAYYLNKLKNTPDGQGSLLDHSMIMYGSGMSNSNEHSKFNLPVALLGGGAGKLKGGRHLKNPDGTPMTNLLVTVLDKMGVRQDHLEDSNGVIADL
jgi:Protein of unknown function (DUF1552)